METTRKSNFQYTNPRITKFHYVFTELPEGQYEINMKHKKEIVKVSESEAKVALEMIISSDDDSSPFEILFSVEAGFRWEDFDNSTISTLLSQTAPALLLGYARPVVAMFTNSSGIMPFNIPMVDFTQEPIVDFSEI